mmetsp:Transcript_18345/g.27312  ORF Transcript_18345/g.27312 Transcript_18345/m.27312 type:complete len:340 (-) Transcript_18345:754-1773(-)
MGLFERGCIVCTITSHTHNLFVVLETFDQAQFVQRLATCNHLECWQNLVHFLVGKHTESISFQCISVSSEDTCFFCNRFGGKNRITSYHAHRHSSSFTITHSPWYLGADWIFNTKERNKCQVELWWRGLIMVKFIERTGGQRKCTPSLAHKFALVLFHFFFDLSFELGNLSISGQDIHTIFKHPLWGTFNVNTIVIAFFDHGRRFLTIGRKQKHLFERDVLAHITVRYPLFVTKHKHRTFSCRLAKHVLAVIVHGKFTSRVETDVLVYQRFNVVIEVNVHWHRVKLLTSNPTRCQRHAVFCQRTSLIRANIGRTTHRFTCTQMAHKIVVLVHLFHRVGE